MAEHDERPVEPEDPALSVAARHALHDEELIAAFAVDGESADDAERARSLIERCTACHALHDDLAAITGAIRSTGNAATDEVAMRAPRDFRLSVATANRLRPGFVVLRLRDRLAAAFGSLGRPVGMSMATLGVVGLLLGSFTLGGGAAMAPVPGDIGTTVGAPDGTAMGELNGPAGTPAGTNRLTQVPEPTGSTVVVDGRDGPVATGGGGPVLQVAVLGASIALLAGGLALVVLGSRRREPIARG